MSMDSDDFYSDDSGEGGSLLTSGSEDETESDSEEDVDEIDESDSLKPENDKKDVGMSFEEYLGWKSISKPRKNNETQPEVLPVEDSDKEDEPKTYFCHLCKVDVFVVDEKYHILGSIHKRLVSKSIEKGFHCDTCNVSSLSKPSFIIHIKGEKHKQKKEQERRSSPLYCRVCNMLEISKESYLTHLKGEFHYKMEKKSLRCEICNIPFISVISLDEHLKSEKHNERFIEISSKGNHNNVLVRKKRKIPQLKFIDEKIKIKRHVPIKPPVIYTKTKEPILSSFYCDLCDVVCPNEFSFAQHNGGKKHLNRLDEAKYHQQQGSDGRKLSKFLRCDICDISVVSVIDLDKHLNGKKHKSRMMEISGKKKKKKKKNEKQQAESFCEICHLMCKSRKEYQKHLRSEEHRQQQIVEYEQQQKQKNNIKTMKKIKKIEPLPTTAKIQNKKKKKKQLFPPLPKVKIVRKKKNQFPPQEIIIESLKVTKPEKKVIHTLPEEKQEEKSSDLSQSIRNSKEEKIPVLQHLFHHPNTTIPHPLLANNNNNTSFQQQQNDINSNNNLLCHNNNFMGDLMLKMDRLLSLFEHPQTGILNRVTRLENEERRKRNDLEKKVLKLESKIKSLQQTTNNNNKEEEEENENEDIEDLFFEERSIWESTMRSNNDNLKLEEKESSNEIMSESYHHENLFRMKEEEEDNFYTHPKISVPVNDSLLPLQPQIRMRIISSRTLEALQSNELTQYLASNFFNQQHQKRKKLENIIIRNIQYEKDGDNFFIDLGRRSDVIEIIKSLDLKPIDQPPGLFNSKKNMGDNVQIVDLYATCTTTINYDGDDNEETRNNKEQQVLFDILIQGFPINVKWVDLKKYICDEFAKFCPIVDLRKEWKDDATSIEVLVKFCNTEVSNDEPRNNLFLFLKSKSFVFVKNRLKFKVL